MASTIDFSEQLFLYEVISQSRYLCMGTGVDVL